MHHHEFPTHFFYKACVGGAVFLVFTLLSAQAATRYFYSIAAPEPVSENPSIAIEQLTNQSDVCFYRITSPGDYYAELKLCGGLGCVWPDGGYCLNDHRCFGPDYSPTKQYDGIVHDPLCLDAYGTPL